VSVCAISFWEAAMLAARGRVDLWQSPESWRLDWLGAGLKEIALAQGATLVTADQTILSWRGPLQRHSAAG
jgi:PIN domain nuclease of toxin-antitoxin system